jgi:hypothetical protein
MESPNNAGVLYTGTSIVGFEQKSYEIKIVTLSQEM